MWSLTQEGAGMDTYVEQYRRLEDHASELESVAEDYRARADEDRWEQCRIAYEAVESGEFSRRSFAEAIGKSDHHVGVQYRVWAEWGARSTSQRPDYSQAYAEADGKPSGSDATRHRVKGGVRNLPPEDKRQTFKELARDPDVIDDEDTVAEVARDPGIRRKVHEQASDDARKANAGTVSSNPAVRDAVETGTDAAVLEALHKAVASVRKASRLASSLDTSPEQRERYAALLDQLSEEIEVARFNLDVAEATSV